LRAAVLKANRILVVEDRAETELDPEKCRVEIHATGVCSSDISRSCENGAYNYPLVMGHEMAGTVVEVGDKVAGEQQVGDRVAIFPLMPCFECQSCARQMYAQCIAYDYLGSRSDGGYAERLDVMPWNLLAVPDAVSLDDAALTEPTAVVAHSVQLLDVVANSNLLIIGAGFLGLLALQVIKASGVDARITLIDRNAHKLEIARKLGGQVMLATDASEMTALARNLDGQFDRVLEATGAPLGYNTALQMCDRGGVVVWMGNISGDLEISQSDVSQILRRELTIKGSWNSTYNAAASSDWTWALECMEKGLRPSSLVNKVLGLEELPEALLQLHDNKKNPQGISPVKYMVKP
jgi:L-iditol 2-dehydrogenase